MKLNKKISQLSTESAFQVLARAQLLESKGANIIHLEIGEPDYATPGNICDAATTALKKGYTRYCSPQGLPELRTKIASRLEEERGIFINPEQVVVTPGAKPIMFYTMLALLEEGDEVIFPNPSFPIYESLINFTGAKPIPIPLCEDMDFRFNIDELETKVTPRTKLIILNSPHNPTGSILEEEDINALAEIAIKHDITVLSDEIYEHFVYDTVHYSIACVSGMENRTILVSGFSKSYAMTGWRLGYAVLPVELIDPVVRLIINSISCTAPFTQLAGIEALTGTKTSLQEMVSAFKKRRDFIVDGLNSIPGIRCPLPKGAFYVFPNIKDLGMESQQLADYLLNEAGVATLAGSSFGNYGEGYLRISYATSMQNIERAIQRIRDVIMKTTS
ncbi:pyridoxal phosphate-dependent aminotransferase [Chloroflexota bacterium]